MIIDLTIDIKAKNQNNHFFTSKEDHDAKHLTISQIRSQTWTASCWVIYNNRLG
jgi:hypothetical protein